jgi:peptidyl-prolyl cis-trans isomerase A (cyclophilin A)
VVWEVTRGVGTGYVASMTRTSLARSAGVLLMLIAAAGCSRGEPTPASTGDEPKPAAATTTTAAGATAAATNAPTSAARDGNSPIFHPEKAAETAPDKFKVKFTTTKGDFVVEATRAWSPNGADRFYNLVKLGFYDGVRFYRAVDGFMVQFGIHPDPSVNGAWYKANIPDDRVVKSNTRGYVTFAMAGPGTRTTQIFINYADKNSRLDGMGFAPFAQVVDGMKVVDGLYKGYGETAPRGKGPDASRASREGEAYLAKEFPELDKIKEARIVP